MKRTTWLAAIAALFHLTMQVHAGPIVDEAAKAEALIGEGKRVDAILAMDLAIAKLWDELPLTFIEAMFVTERPTGYGAYTPRPDNAFKLGEDRIVYIEMAGYEFGRDGDYFTIGMSADVAVTNDAGKVLGGQKDFIKLSLRSRVPNREFFAVIIYNFNGLAAGKHTVTTTVKDAASDDKSTFDLEFVIKP